MVGLANYIQQMSEIQTCLKSKLSYVSENRTLGSEISENQTSSDFRHSLYLYTNHACLKQEPVT